MNSGSTTTPEMIDESIPNSMAPKPAWAQSIDASLIDEESYGTRQSNGPPAIDFGRVLLHSLIVNDSAEETIPKRFAIRRGSHRG